MTFGFTRQAYYKHSKLEDNRAKRDEKVLSEVRNIRKEQPKVGGRKLQIMLANLEREELKIGRDQLFELLAMNGMLVKKKPRFTRTSISNRNSVNYPNLLYKEHIYRVNQAWVVDITYLNTCNGFVYLYLVTDMHSRKIISYVVADSLKAKHACSALLKAISTVDNPEGIIHHSDHGSQYSSEEYQKILKSNKMLCSMTGRDRCYDNAIAERVNGILKHEFGLSKVLPSLMIAQELTSDSIRIYNSKRLHKALMYKTPEAVYNAA